MRKQFEPFRQYGSLGVFKVLEATAGAVSPPVVSYLGVPSLLASIPVDAPNSRAGTTRPSQILLVLLIGHLPEMIGSHAVESVAGVIDLVPRLYRAYVKLVRIPMREEVLCETRGRPHTHTG